jgi:hypothetical protein
MGSKYAGGLGAMGRILWGGRDLLGQNVLHSEEAGGLFFTWACRGDSAAIFCVSAKNPSEKKNGVFVR